MFHALATHDQAILSITILEKEEDDWEIKWCIKFIEKVCYCCNMVQDASQWSYSYHHSFCEEVYEEHGAQIRLDLQGRSDEDDHLLWVEKYAPRHYTELLSDDVCDNWVCQICQSTPINVRELIEHFYHGLNSGMGPYLVILFPWGADQALEIESEVKKNEVILEWCLKERSLTGELIIRTQLHSLHSRLSTFLA